MVNCYAALGEKQTLQSHTYENKTLNPWQIEVDITHCGICHSDIHLIDNDWDVSVYPLIPGHEVVGIVKGKGKNVTSLKKGTRVGIGWQSASCLNCEWCMQGKENLCKLARPTCVGRPGGFAEKIIVDSRFAFKLPDALASENAGPLLCGGITVYSPLRDFDINASMRVGVIGIGGLGHLALQFMRAFGCDVTAFSSSPAKEEEARKFGANHFISSRDYDAMQHAVNSFDFILSTVHVDLDWPTYIDLLRPKGRLCFVGAVENDIKLSAFSLIAGNKSICGSGIGNRTTMNEMLSFAARHNIKAKTEIMPMSQVNEAILKVRNNEARYRIVLEN